MTDLSVPGPTGAPRHAWYLYLYPRLSRRARRRLAAMLLVATMVAQSAAGHAKANLGADAGASAGSGTSQHTPFTVRPSGASSAAPAAADPYESPAVQKALRELGIDAPAAPQAPAGPASMDNVPGAQFEVNTYTTSTQQSASVGMDADGDFVVVWSSYGSSGSDTSGSSIQGQQYNSVGTAQGGEFQVNTYTTGGQHFPSVAMDADGDFVVVWFSYGSYGTDTDGESIQGQRYNSAGTAQGSQFQVNIYTTNAQRDPSVAIDSDGDVVVVWSSYGSGNPDTDGGSIQGQRYNSAGTAQGSEFQINSYTTNSQRNASVALDSDGDFVVVWASNGSYGSDTDSYSIQGQRFNPVGTAQGVEFQVNTTYTTATQWYPSVALDSDGDFVVVWQSYGSSGSDTSGNSIQGKRYNSVGTAAGSEFQVNTYITGSQHYPSVALDANGDFVVVWQSDGSSGSDTSGLSIQGRSFRRDGLALHGEFQINTYTTNSQRYPAVALDANGDFVVVWQSNGSSGGDTDPYSIQATRFDLGQSDYQVNQYTTGNQRRPSVAVDSDGDFVVVWSSSGSSGSDTSFYSIQGRRFDSAGEPRGSQFQVNTYTTSEQLFPSVGLDADGDFVVVWQSDGSSGSDTSDLSVQGQRYNAAGTAQGSQFQVNTYTTSFQNFPSVAVDSDGDFVVAWQSYGSSGSDTSGRSIQAQRYNAAGAAVGSQFQVNSYTTDDQELPSVAVDSDGDFVVVWQSYGSSGSDTSIHSIQGQRYNAAGTAQGSQFQVNSYTTGQQRFPSVGLDSDGDFVVAWQSNGSSYGDTSINSIQGQRYNAAGTAVGSQFQVNTYTTNSQRYPSVALDSDGDFVVVWDSGDIFSSGSPGTDTSQSSIQGQRYNAAGTPQGSQFQVNTYTTLSQLYQSVAMDADGDFVVVWQSNGVADPPSPHFLLAGDAPDGPTGLDADSGYGIAVSRFSAQGASLPTAVTLVGLGAQAVGGGLAAALAGLGAVVGGWWLGVGRWRRKTRWRRMKG